MSTLTRRSFRLFVLALVGAGLTACCFHGHHCHPFRVPVRHCR